MTTTTTPKDLWSIDELAAKANAALAQAEPSLSTDSRMRGQMTSRNLRRLVAQGAVDAPARVGREAYYGPKHLGQILEARALMGKGFTSSSISSLRSASSSASASYEEDRQDAETAWSAGESQESQEPQAPSTMAALHFLNAVGAPRTGGRLAEPSPFDLSGKALYASASASCGLLEGGALDMSKAYVNLAESALARRLEGPRKEPSGQALSALIETEPFPGARLSLRSESVQAPLSEWQKQAFRDSLELAWARALSEKPKRGGTS